MKKYKVSLLTGPLLLLPFIASAQVLQNTAGGGDGCGVPKNFAGVFDYAICLLNSYVVPFLISLGMIIFIAGVISFVKAGDDEEKRSAGRNMMLFGIISLFVMISVWGLVRIIHNSIFGSDQELRNPSLPPRTDPDEVFRAQ